MAQHRKWKSPMGGFVAVLFATLALATTGCGRDWKLEVDSNTTWSGSYGSWTGYSYSSGDITGSGSRTFDLPDDDRVCAAFTQTGNGYLRVAIKDKGGFLGLFKEDSRTTETNVRGGYADICTEGLVER
jgi:hypothetical protein